MPKKTKEKRRRTRKRIQKGGTIYSFGEDANSKCLQHVGIGSSADNSCGACTVNQLGFPEDIVDALSNTAGTYDGVNDNQMLDKINEVKNRLGYQSRDDLYWWGAMPGNPTEVAVARQIGPVQGRQHPNGVSPMIFPNTIKKAIRGVFDTLKDQTASILGIWWRGSGGHYVTIAKDSLGTPFIIESQDQGCGGLWQGLNEIYEYFTSRGAGVPEFLGTFNNSSPQPLPDGGWSLDFNKELELDLSRFKRKTPKLVDQARTIYPMQRDNEEYGKDPMDEDDPRDYPARDDSSQQQQYQQQQLAQQQLAQQQYSHLPPMEWYPGAQQQYQQYSHLPPMEWYPGAAGRRGGKKKTE